MYDRIAGLVNEMELYWKSKERAVFVVLEGAPLVMVAL